MIEKVSSKVAAEKKPVGEKLQKVLAGLGLGSRREIEKWIEDGRLRINKRVAKLGDRVTPRQKIFLDDRLLELEQTEQPKTRVLLYHKAVGTLCTRRDEKDRRTVFEDLPSIKTGRWIMIGRLDLNTSGMLLFTNDGELAHRLMHPSQQIEREYAVRVFGEVAPEVLTRLKAGVKLEDGPARFDSLSDEGGEGSNHWYRVKVREGRNRIVRRLWESQGVVVSRLIRIRFGTVTLPRFLSRGQFIELKPGQINALKNVAGLV